MRMDNQELMYIAMFGVGFVVLILVFILIFTQRVLKMFERTHTNDLNALEEKLTDEVREIKEKINYDLFTFQNQLSSHMKDDFTRLNETTVNRLVHIEEKVNSSMQKGLSTTYKSFTKIMEQMARIDTTQKNLENLSTSINSLQNILTDKKNRGTFGEVELYSILENQFGLNERRYSKQYKLSEGKIADAVLFAPQPLGMICIDSKFPLENYNRMYSDELSKEEREKARKLFRNDIIVKVKDIANKYIIPGETAEFAYMFIPAEAVFSEIYGRFDDIVQYSYRMHVYMVSPTTLMSYLTAMQAIYLGQEKNERVLEMQKEFLRLSKEFERFALRFEKINTDFTKTHNDLHDVSITANKIISKFKDIEAVKLDHTLDSE
ncbi:MAG: DNA recombination protein RmuC [Erysipelotrichales bacterium]|nr:DNA recombination protein RmuC [Erysipelotrichales bacterium]